MEDAINFYTFLKYGPIQSWIKLLRKFPFQALSVVREGGGGGGGERTSNCCGILKGEIVNKCFMTVFVRYS